jgi:uroporphyrinogen-III decarboxylase
VTILFSVPLLHIIANQEKLMATAADIQTVLDGLTTAVQALEAKESSTSPTVLQSDLDPIVASIQQLTASIQAIVDKPAA